MKRIINQELRLNQLVKVIVKKFGGNVKIAILSGKQLLFQEIMVIINALNVKIDLVNDRKANY